MKYRKNGTDAVCGQCDLCGGELRRGERYYRISGENVCRGCLADFAAQILAAYEVGGGTAVQTVQVLMGEGVRELSE